MDTAAVEQESIYLCEFSPQLQANALDWAKKYAFIKHILTSSSSSLATSHKKLDIAIKAFSADDTRIPPYQTAVRVHGEVEGAARARARALDQEWAAWREIIYTAIRCSADEKERHRKEELQGESDKALFESGYKQFEWVEEVRRILGQLGAEGVRQWEGMKEGFGGVAIGEKRPEG